MSFLGKLARPLRAGDSKLAIHEFEKNVEPLEVGSPAFVHGGPMPELFVGIKGESPPLEWKAPEGTRSITLIIEDVDVPAPAPLVHAIAYDIDPTLPALPAGALPRMGSHDPKPSGFRVGKGFGGEVYAPPTPIPGHGPHHYVFQLFALDEIPVFSEAPSKREMVQAMHGHVLAAGAVVGTHEVP